MRELALNKIIYFEAVARHSRLSTAADELLVSTSAVSQQIKQLEEQLGVSLFRRVKRRLVLTEDGERLYQSANKAINILKNARQQIARKKESQKLIVRVSASFGVRWLGPRVARFIAINSMWDLHIDATPELTDFEKENVDLDVRYGKGNWPGLYTRPILSDAVLPLCSPAYPIFQNQSDRSIGSVLVESRLIHTVKAHLSWSNWLNLNNLNNINTHHGLRFDRSSMALQAARDGAGIALESATLAMDELRSGELVPAFPDAFVVRFPAYWFICPNRNLDLKVVKIFSEWLDKESTAHEQRKKQMLLSLGCEQYIDI